ncbi:zinc finger protein 211-like [Limulus polyphemus]|uniref:Zinc finger protein 211-like n=1 Tax=Limulus polyphemus TaxID=6850 RepID=A0ABM1B612_LIMPO|nr:zinc finger protein 211-like [Limulus polyphemus]
MVLLPVGTEQWYYKNQRIGTDLTSQGLRACSRKDSSSDNVGKKRKSAESVFPENLDRYPFLKGEICSFNEHKTARLLPATFAGRGCIEYRRESERPVCGQCGKVFVSLRSLSVHATEHMNAVDYSAGHKPLNNRPSPKEPASFGSETASRAYDGGQDRRATPVAVSTHHVTRDSSKSGVPLLERGKVNRSQKLLTGLSLPCPVCGKTFVAMRNLESHLKSHTKQRPYQCLDCGKSFSLRNTLICHTRVHTKERPYTCSLCFKSFTQASTLKSHVIYKHTKQFPHKCDTCGRGFISPGQKMEHVTRLHGPGSSVSSNEQQ